MPVFFVHDVRQGLVTPLDRKFRVRDIPPVDEVSKSQKIHDKNESNPKEYHSPHKDHAQYRQAQPKNPLAEQYYQAENSASPDSLGCVRDIMSSPVLSITQDHSLADAWKMMAKYEIHHLIILNDNNSYCGLLSEKSIVPYMMARANESFDDGLAESTPLTTFCQESLLSTHPSTLITDLVPALLEYGLDGIAVTENNQIVGIITYPDILKIILKSKSFEANA
jgi:CBS domain-containing protein